jgi:hypothetical protein
MKVSLKTFYRVGHILTGQGLWYDAHGNFTGLIHGKFSFLKSSELEMPPDPEVIGYLSAVLTLEELKNWFSDWDIRMLEPHGFRVMEYVASDYKFRNGHYLINQQTSILNRIL